MPTAVITRRNLTEFNTRQPLDLNAREVPLKYAQQLFFSVTDNVICTANAFVVVRQAPKLYPKSDHRLPRQQPYQFTGHRITTRR